MPPHFISLEEIKNNEKNNYHDDSGRAFAGGLWLNSRTKGRRSVANLLA
jgi:hypothetical protein